MGESLHVTMASYGPQLKDKDGRSVVTVKVGDSEKKFAVCALSAGKTESSMLDIHFTGEEKVTFTLSGKNEVHLVGNFMFEDLGDSDDMEEEEDLIDVYDDGAMGEHSDDSEEVEAPTLMIDSDPPVITEVKEDVEEDEDEDDEKDEEEKEAAVVVKAKKVKQSKAAVKANGKTPEKQNPKTPEKQSGKKVKAKGNKAEAHKAEVKEDKAKEDKAKEEKAKEEKAKEEKAKEDKAEVEAVKTPNAHPKQKPAVKKAGKSKTPAKSEEKTADEKPTPAHTGKRKNC